MKLMTPVDISPSPLSVGYDTPMLLLGSCFTDEIGKKLQAAGFDLLCNPFGTLYNPLSIAACLQRAVDNRPMQADELVWHDGLWHSWLHHSRFSHADRNQCLSCCNEAIHQTHAFIERKPLLMVTFGTAWVFERGGSVVANCHKVPQREFNRRRLTVQEIVETWQPLSARLACPTLFTVSPIRHLADGAHGNQLSKATLMLAVDSMVNANPQTYYFDSYELLMDELRDYRFYARDMCHPSEVAVDIVWERFQEAYMSTETRDSVHRQEKTYSQSQHRQIIKNRLQTFI